jgi:hypothetical protein
MLPELSNALTVTVTGAVDVIGVPAVNVADDKASVMWLTTPLSVNGVAALAPAVTAIVNAACESKFAGAADAATALYVATVKTSFPTTAGAVTVHVSDVVPVQAGLSVERFVAIEAGVPV